MTPASPSPPPTGTAIPRPPPPPPPRTSITSRLELPRFPRMAAHYPGGAASKGGVGLPRAAGRDRRPRVERIRPLRRRASDRRPCPWSSAGDAAGPACRPRPARPTGDGGPACPPRPARPTGDGGPASAGAAAPAAPRPPPPPRGAAGGRGLLARRPLDGRRRREERRLGGLRLHGAPPARRLRRLGGGGVGRRLLGRVHRAEPAARVWRRLVLRRLRVGVRLGRARRYGTARAARFRRLRRRLGARGSGGIR